MIVRIWLLLGAITIGGAWYLAVLDVPRAFQAAAPGMIESYRAAGLMQAPGKLTESTSIGHEIFELPADDAKHLAEELASQMSGMNMGGDAAPSAAMQMPAGESMPETGMSAMNMDGDAAPSAAMQMPAGETMPEAGMSAMNMDGDAAPSAAMQMPAGESMPETGMSAMNMDGDAAPSAAMQMPAGEAMPEPGMSAMNMARTEEAGHEDDEDEEAGGGGGLELVSANSGSAVDRTIAFSMTEWGYSNNRIMVKEGETVRLVVTNAGTIPHEFMIMTGPGMASVGYRIERADWNLTEHEAIFEKPLVMQGETFETVIKIDQPGAWMFMCMFPYHMQLGMMGMMMTEGMEGMNMGGMNM